MQRLVYFWLLVAFVPPVVCADEELVPTSSMGAIDSAVDSMAALVANPPATRTARIEAAWAILALVHSESQVSIVQRQAVVEALAAVAVQPCEDPRLRVEAIRTLVALSQNAPPPLNSWISERLGTLTQTADGIRVEAICTLVAVAGKNPRSVSVPVAN